MENITSEWKISSRDNKMHRLDWGKDNPQVIIKAREELKEKIIKLNDELESPLNLKNEYPGLFD